MNLNTITIGEIWIALFNIIGAIHIANIIWISNIIFSVGLICWGNKFWKWFGWLNIIASCLYFTARLLTS